jgi:hypothetical protein
MTRTASHLELDLLRSHFLFGDSVLDNACRTWLAVDMRRAQLSPLFRAYYQIRSLIPISVRQRLQRLRQVQASERWCYPDEFVADVTRRVYALDDGLPIIHPWPDGAEFAFILTHDIETAEGQRRVAEIADMEEFLGFRSSWNFVPYKYPVDYGLMRDLVSRGFEIGVHGYNHDGRLFTSRTVFNHRAPAINETIKAWGVVGFRAPMVHRNLAWLQDLDIKYDASCFDADPFQAMPGGVGSVWPFIAGRVVELPYTLPQDHTLFVALGLQNGDIWRAKLDYLKRVSGMSLVITHPDYLDSTSRIDCYRDLLCLARDSADMWHALPKEVADWWCERDSSTLCRNWDDTWRLDGPAAIRGRAAVVRISDPTKVIPWTIESCPIAKQDACAVSHV